MDKNFSYPIFEDWNREEMINVIAFFIEIEKAYENKVGTKRVDLINRYDKFRQINPSKVEQKKLERDFENNSGYKVFPVLKKLDDSTLKFIKM